MAHLPMTRIKTIMKTTDGADSVSKESVLLTTRATELFIKELALAGVKNLDKKEKRLNYGNLVNVVHSNNKYEFLEYMIPKKITVKEFKELTLKKNETKRNYSPDGSVASGSICSSGSESGDEKD